MLQPVFIYTLVVLLSLVYADSTIESLAHTTVSPNVDQILRGSWTVSIALPSTRTIEADIQTAFNKIDTVTLIGPTTFISFIHIKTATSNAATRGATLASLATIASRTATSSASPSYSFAYKGSLSSERLSTNSMTHEKQKSTTAPPAVIGMDPDSYMAAQYSKAYANITYTPPAYKPASISPDECVLWDDTCKGNKTLAADKFFGVGGYNGTMFALIGDSCFDDVDSVATGTNCTSALLDPASPSLSSAAKSYMRQSQCASDYSSVQTGFHNFPDCCGQCWIYGPNVDVYYWPEPDADSSCLDLIGSSVIPENEGAQTDADGVVYWAATTNPYDIYIPTVTTARIITINGVLVKEALANPWAGSGSITTTRPVPSNKKRIPLSVHPRAFKSIIKKDFVGTNSSHSADVPSSTGISNATGSLAVSDGFTFTSPSIYVAFYSLSATDMCGLRGARVSSTMLAFAPGELSTVQGHLWSGGDQIKSTRVFDFADLPCPPQSVMEADWYKPAPGEPYRPLIALPDKVRSLDPMWEACTEAFYFTGLDPPRTLQVGTSLVAPMTAADPTITPNSAQPMPSLPTNTGFNLPSPADAMGDPHARAQSLVPPNPPAATASANTPPMAKSQAQDPSAEGTKSPFSLYFGSGSEDANLNESFPAQRSELSPALAPEPSQIFNTDAQPNPSASKPGAAPGPEPAPAPASPVVKPISDNTPSEVTELTPTPSPARIVIGSSTYPLPQFTALLAPAPVVASTPIAVVRVGSSQVGSQTLVPGGATVNIDGTSVHINPQSAPVISTLNYPSPEPAVTTIIGSHTVVASSAGVAVNGRPIQPNAAPVDVGGTPVQFQNPTIGNSHADNNPAPSTKPTISPLVLNAPGGKALTQVPNKPNAYMIAGTTLLAGGSPALVSGTSYSLAPSGSLAIGTSTIPLATSAAGHEGDGALTAGNNVFTPLGSAAVEVNGATLSLSGPATTALHGTTILSLASEGLFVVGSLTYAFATPVPAPVPNTDAATTQGLPLLTALDVDGQAITVVNPSAFAVNGTTISAGGPGVTISGTPVVVDSGAGDVVVGSNTISLESSNKTGFAVASPTEAIFEGSTARIMKVHCCWALMMGLLLTLMMVGWLI